MKNYYNILHVSSAADAAQIKRSYRILAKRYHPDRHGGSLFHEEKFKEINEAYCVLMDPGKRDAYNRQLVVRVRPRPKPQSQATPRPASTWAPPEYAPGNDGGSGRPHRNRQGGAVQNRGEGRFFWSLVLIMVFLFPAWMSNDADAGLPHAEQVSYDMTEKLNQRFKQEVFYLNEIKRVDPDLQRLDLSTGSYQLNGKTIRLSWDTLQLIRKNGWKARS